MVFKFLGIVQNMACIDLIWKQHLWLNDYYTIMLSKHEHNYPVQFSNIIKQYLINWSLFRYSTLDCGTFLVVLKRNFVFLSLSCTKLLPLFSSNFFYIYRILFNIRPLQFVTFLWIFLTPIFWNWDLKKLKSLLEF